MLESDALVTGWLLEHPLAQFLAGLRWWEAAGRSALVWAGCGEFCITGKCSPRSGARYLNVSL